MNLDDARYMALSLLTEHKVGDNWQFRFDDGIRRFGCCDWGKKEIRLSRRLTEANRLEVVRLTLLHEIAHALCGPGVGHAQEWVRVCLAIGGDGKRCYDTVDSGRGSVVRVARTQRFTFKEGN